MKNIKKLSTLFYSKKSVLPILRNVMINNKEATFTNLKTTVKISNVDMPNMVVNMKDIVQVSSKTKDAQYIVGDSELVIKNLFSSVTIPVEYENEFPKYPSLGDVLNEFSISESTVNSIKEAISFASTNELRPALNCILIDKNNVVSTDAFTLYFNPHKLDISPSDGSVLISKLTAKVLSLFPDDYKVIVYNEFVVFKSKLISITQRFINEKYPEYKRVIPSDGMDYIFKKSELLQMIELSKSIDAKDVLINKGVAISYNEWYQDKQARFNLNTDFTGSIKLNISYLKKALSCIKSEKITMNIRDARRAIIINNKVLLMPITIND